MYRHFVFSLSFLLGMYRVCTGVSFSIRYIYTHRLFVFSLSFPLDMCRVCTGVSFSIKLKRYIYMYRLFVLSLSFPLGMCRMCTGVSFSIKDIIYVQTLCFLSVLPFRYVQSVHWSFLFYNIYMYRLFVFSVSFPLGMCRVCTGVSFSIKYIYVQTLCFLSVLPFRYVQSVHWSFLFCKTKRYICTDSLFSLCPSL